MKILFRALDLLPANVTEAMVVACVKTYFRTKAKVAGLKKHGLRHHSADTTVVGKDTVSAEP